MGDGILTEKQAQQDYGQEFKQDWQHVREEADAPKKGDPFSGGHGKKAELPGASAGEEKHVGQGGFGARLIGASTDEAQQHAGEWGDIATPVQPVTGVLDKGLDAQRASVEKNSTSDYYDGDPDWLKQEKKYSVAWATENMTTIERYKFEQMRWCGAYNTWTPLANASHMAMAELVESAGLMGFDTTKGKDAAGFIEGLETSLDMAIQLADAKVLDGGKASWSTRGDSNKAGGATKAQPELKGEQVTPKLAGIRDAYNGVQVAYHGVYRSLLNDRKRALDAEGGKYSAEIGEITEVIEFWSGMGEVVEGKAKTAKKLATGQTGASLDKRFGNNGDHYANKELHTAQKQAHAAEKDPSDYRSDIDAHAHADNYEQHYDTWGKGGQATLKKAEEEGDYTPTEVEPAEMPEFSVGGAIKAGLTLAYSGKLEGLQKKLYGVQALAKANGKTIEMVETRAAQAAYEAAVTKLQDEAKKIEAETLRDREQEMVAFGRDLDAYALEHKDELQKLHAGELVPGANGEVYGTALACVAKVEKYRQLSKLALSTFPFDEFNNTVTHIGRERVGAEKPPESASRSDQHAYRPPPALPEMSDEERDVYQQIAGSYLMLLQLDTRWSIRLEGVSSKFRALMKKVSGTNSKDAVGKQF